MPAHCYIMSFDHNTPPILRYYPNIDSLLLLDKPEVLSEVISALHELLGLGRFNLLLWLLAVEPTILETFVSKDANQGCHTNWKCIRQKSANEKMCRHCSYQSAIMTFSHIYNRWSVIPNNQLLIPGTSPTGHDPGHWSGSQSSTLKSGNIRLLPYVIWVYWRDILIVTNVAVHMLKINSYPINQNIKKL